MVSSGRGRSCPCNKLISIALFLVFFIDSAVTYAQDNKESYGIQITLLEAVARTLENQPNILLQQQEVQFASGKFQEARGQFDTILGTSAGYSHDELPLSRAERLSLGISDEVTDTTTYQLDLTKQLRTGMTLVPNFSIVRTDSAVPAVNTLNSSQLSFLVVIPLLKGRGTEATTANEKATKSDYESTMMLMRHVISRSALDTILAYWNCLAARNTLRELQETESRAQRMLDDTKSLIEHDELPQAELTQVEANLADKTVARIAGEQKLLEATQALGLAIGLTGDQMASAPSPAGDFPIPRIEMINRAEREVRALTEISLQKREDYQAARQQQETTRVLLAAAKNNLLPKLNMDVKVGYNGLSEDSETSKFFSSAGNDVSGVNASLFLRYEWPFENNSARGLFAQRAALHKQSIIRTNDLERKIVSDVITAISALKRSYEELSKAQSSVRYYQSAVQNEKKKFQHGMSTLLDVILVEDLSTNARLNEIQSRQKVASALAQLRFGTGTLLNVHDDKISVGEAELTTVPVH